MDRIKQCLLTLLNRIIYFIHKVWYDKWLVLVCLLLFIPLIFYIYTFASNGISDDIITAKRKATTFKNEMCFPLTKTKCKFKKHPNNKFECFFMNLIEQRPVYFFLFFPS